MINNTLGSLMGSCCVAYMDNILVFSSLEDQHKIDLEKVILALSSQSLVLKRSNCEFFKKKVTILGSLFLRMVTQCVPVSLLPLLTRNVLRIGLNFVHFWAQ